MYKDEDTDVCILGMNCAGFEDSEYRLLSSALLATILSGCVVIRIYFFVMKSNSDIDKAASRFT